MLLVSVNVTACAASASSVLLLTTPPRSAAPAALSPSLALYPALTTYPKHALSPEAAAGIVHGNKEGKRAEGRAKNQAEIRQVVGEGNARS